MKNALHSILGAAIIALAAQFSIDVELGEFEIPITGQTLAVITWCMMVKRSTAITGLVLYLILGGLGLPVFAEGSSGWEKLTGPTAGYLWSFLLVAFLVSNQLSKSFLKLLATQFLATFLILLGGYLILSFFTENAFSLGVKPFVIGGLVKSLLGAIAVYFWNKKWR